MHTLFSTLYILLLSSLVTVSLAQTIVSDSTLDMASEDQFRARVKVIDEFIERFNYEAYMMNDSLPRDPEGENRRELILSLFERSYLDTASRQQLREIDNFLGLVTLPGHPIHLAAGDQRWYADTHWQAEIDGKAITVQIVFIPELIDGIPRWSIASVQAPELNLQPENPGSALSPISHNLDFMKLKAEILRDPKDVEAYASRDYISDQRPVFFHLVKTGRLKLLDSPRPEYIFCQINGWMFTVKHFEKADENTGWRIAQLQRMPETDKARYVQQRLHLNGY